MLKEEIYFFVIYAFSMVDINVKHGKVSNNENNIGNVIHKLVLNA